MRWCRGELDTVGLGMAGARTPFVSGSRPVRLRDPGSACIHPEDLASIPGSPCVHPRIPGSGPVHLGPFLGSRRPRGEPYSSWVRISAIHTHPGFGAHPSRAAFELRMAEMRSPSNSGSYPVHLSIPGSSCVHPRIQGSCPVHLSIPGSPCVHLRIPGSGPVHPGPFLGSRRPRGEPHSSRVRLASIRASRVRALSIQGRFWAPDGQGANPIRCGFAYRPSTRIQGSYPGRLRRPSKRQAHYIPSRRPQPPQAPVSPRPRPTFPRRCKTIP